MNAGGSRGPQQQPPDRSGVPFPHQQARSPTPQSPPKRVDELMSEFREFESVHGGGGSPTPPMFTSGARPPGNSLTAVASDQMEDEEEKSGRPPPAGQRLRDDASPPRGPSTTTSGPTKGPAVYYPPGADFGKTAAATPRPTADGGSMSLEQGGGGGAKAMKQSRAGRGDRYASSDGADKQGAAVIPICLPLCCAAPCVIM
jgi:hypothetical protein